MTFSFPPDWPAIPGVCALSTTRQGGVSAAPYDSFNLGGRVGDAPDAVAANRARLRELLPAEPAWLTQVHGPQVVDLDSLRAGTLPEADASFTREKGVVCAIMTADCLPVLFAAQDGSVVGAAHAGWRGLYAGVLEQTVAAMGTTALQAWLGPAIGPAHFEVGPEVREAFLEVDHAAACAFVPGEGDRWYADIFVLARQRLQRAGLAADAIFGGQFCTVTDCDRFFSYRRDRTTGRMASLIWRT